MSMAGNAAGDAILLWENRDGQDFQLFATRYTTAGGWEADALLYASTLFHDPTVAIDSAGFAKAAFVDFSVFPDSHLMAASFDPATGWDLPELVNDQDVPREPVIGLDDTGAALIAWRHAGGGGTSISVSRFVVADTWQDREVVKVSPGGSPTPLPPHLDGAGGMIAYWITNSFEDGTKLELSRYDALNGWSEPDSFEFIGANGSVREIALTVHSSGSSVVSWVEGEEAGTDGVFVHEFE
jgi:hypothetical protein